ncbi:MAG: cyclase family protein [Actinomycetota bacterium]
MSRRDAIKMGAGAAAAATAASVVGEAATASAAGANSRYTDEMFDFEAVQEGAWFPGPYGPDDQRGTLNEITPNRTAWATSRLMGGPVTAYQLGEEMFNGFPAFPSDPPRLHDMNLYVFGYEAPQEFVDGGGIQSSPLPFGVNNVTGHEERFKENFTFQIATQVDGLNHVGVGQMYYNGNQALDFITPTGTSVLGNETMGPIATRGIILDVVGLKVAAGATDDFFIAPNGEPVLRDNYRVTIDDIENCLFRQRISPAIRAGDIPIFHTGWTHLVKADAGRYLTQEPGIYLSEARYLADRRVAMVAGDTWGLEVLDPAVTEGFAFPVHQELFVKDGIRIGESFVTDSALADNVSEGLLVITPENVPGATCGSSAPTLLAKPGRPFRS